MEAIIKKIKDAYGIDVSTTEILRDGSDNTVWGIIAKDGKKYAARVSKRVVGDDVAFEAEWLRILKEESVPVVPIILTRDGKSYTLLDNAKVITVFDFLAGKHINITEDNPPPKEAIETAAKALAELHAISKKHIVNLSRKRNIFVELDRVLENEKLIFQKIPEGAKLAAEVKVVLSWGKTQIYTPVLIHNDYRINNIMFDESNQLIAILDFDWSCMGPAIKDVAHSLAEWSFPDGAEKHNEQTFSTFLEVYNRTSDSPISDKIVLHRWIALACLSDACTFLMDRLLIGEVKEPSSSYMYKKYRYFFALE